MSTIQSNAREPDFGRGALEGFDKKPGFWPFNIRQHLKTKKTIKK
jgi:hypothetical protein